MKPNGYKTIDEYIATFSTQHPSPTPANQSHHPQSRSRRRGNHKLQMPAFKQNGVLVYFAAFKNHIGFFPTAQGIEAFKDKLSAYKTSKGTIQFPLDQPLPLDLIVDIVRYRVKTNTSK